MISMTIKPRADRMNEVTPRIKLLREELMRTDAEVFADRARLVTQSYLETIGQPAVIRRAKSLDRVLRNMRLYIREGELIVGNLAEKPFGAPVFPEYDVAFLLNELDELENRVADRFILSQENMAALRDILPSWQGNTIKDQAWQIFTEQEKEAAKDLIIILTAAGSGVGHMIVDYGLVLQKGILWIKKEAEDQLRSIVWQDLADFQKASYYQALHIVCDAVLAYAERFAEKADDLALQTSDPLRKGELEKIAHNCRKVPAYPADSFWEAIQSFWFVHVLLQIESNGHSVSPGRFDQYLYPYYAADLSRKTINLDQIDELLCNVWLKFNEINKIRDRVSSIAFAGYPMYQNMILGGVDRDGHDAVNRLSYHCMDVTERIGMPQPSLSVRWHTGCEDKFLIRACEVTAYGMGMPAFFNDEILIPTMIEEGYQQEEARDYAIVGCVEPTVPGISEPWLTGGFINLAKVLELTLNNGYDPVANLQRNCRSGDIDKMTSYEQFRSAFFQQLSHYIKLHVGCNSKLESVHAALCPTLFQAMLTADCLINGKTSLEGGARHNTITINAIGFANVVDSLMVIKKIVFTDKTLSLSELNAILLHNFTGYEDVRQMLLHQAPKFGNNEDSVDQIGAEVLRQFDHEVSQYRNLRGGRYLGALYSIACHVLLANKVGATPDGRKKSTLLADGGVSCAQGRDLNGPTAVLNSVSSLDLSHAPGGALLNLKFSPSVFHTDEDVKKVAKLIEVFFIKRGQHVQFNVVDTQTLRDAQKHPEKHATLVVRVAGFSVFFNKLDPLAQEDIIQRTEHASR
jgi:formate C-acetyltransferase